MRERLIEILKGFRTPICEGLNFKLPDVEAIADHLLSEGVIVLPCKVGDMVYMPSIWYNQVHSYLVVEINLEAGNNNTVVLDEFVGGFILHRSQAVYFNQFGKTVFLTKEEAEKALAEREGKE